MVLSFSCHFSLLPLLLFFSADGVLLLFLLLLLQKKYMVHQEEATWKIKVYKPWKEKRTRCSNGRAMYAYAKNTVSLVAREMTHDSFSF